MLCVWSLTIIFIATVDKVTSQTIDTLLVTEWKKCATTDNKLRTFYKPISLELYIKRCSRRTHCVGVNYWRRAGSCDLLGSVTGFLSNEVNRKPCVHVSEHAVEDATCNCPLGNMCIEDSTKCFLKDCPVQQVQNGKVHGNMQTVGSKATVVCQEGAQYMPFSAPMVCGNEGNWTNVPTCLIPCPEPCSRFSHTNLAVGEGLLPGAKRTYNCKPGHSTTNGGTFFTIGCRSDSTWTNPTTYCKGKGVVDELSIVGCQVLYFSKVQLNNNGASRWCNGLGLDLIRIDTEEKQRTITEYITANGLSGKDYWIQGKLNGWDKKWYWDDGSELTQFFWAPYAPDGTNENCIRIDTKYDDHKWNDKVCWTRFHFICELFDD